jgi:hypothetical protein
MTDVVDGDKGRGSITAEARQEVWHLFSDGK